MARNQAAQSLHAWNAAEGLIAGKYLVASQAAERHFESRSPGLAGDHKGVDTIHTGLVHRAQGMRDSLDHVSLGRHNLAVLRAELLRHPARKIGFRKVLFLKHQRESADVRSPQPVQRG